MTHELSAEHLTAEMGECIARCTSCYNACVETTIHCLTMGGEHAAVEHIRLLLDCAQVCATSRDYMLRGSDFHPQACGLCAQVCQRYAEWTDEHPGVDAVMRRCGEECRGCAESCRAMAAASA